jgi:hypothetical protein
MHCIDHHYIHSYRLLSPCLVLLPLIASHRIVSRMLVYFSIVNSPAVHSYYTTFPVCRSNRTLSVPLPTYYTASAIPDSSPCIESACVNTSIAGSCLRSVITVYINSTLFYSTKMIVITVNITISSQERSGLLCPCRVFTRMVLHCIVLARLRRNSRHPQHSMRLPSAQSNRNT